MYEDYKKKIDEALEKVIPNKEFYNYIKEYSRGGKRLRAIALMLSYYSNKGNKNILLPSIAIELHHTYSLILDDIMDEDELRRNKPTIYKSMKEYYLKNFQEIDYNGSLFNKKSNRFAVSFGIILGNLTNILSKKAILQSEFEIETKIKALEILENADELLYEGQMMDILMESKDATEKEYLEMAEKKTGILFGVAFEIGALFAKVPENTRYELREMGKNLGIAFQIQDDILDLTDKKGHDIGSDIKKGKKTLLMIKALENKEKIKSIDEMINAQKKYIDYCKKLALQYIENTRKISKKYREIENFIFFVLSNLLK